MTKELLGTVSRVSLHSISSLENLTMKFRFVSPKEYFSNWQDAWNAMCEGLEYSWEASSSWPNRLGVCIAAILCTIIMTCLCLIGVRPQ